MIFRLFEAAGVLLSLVVIAMSSTKAIVLVLRLVGKLDMKK